MCRNELGLDQQIIQSPLLKIEMLPIATELTQYRGLIFTSENSVSAFAQSQSRRDLPAYCVGGRTAKAAIEAGLEAHSANGSADDLVAMVQAADVAGPLLHIRGEHSRGEIADRISAQVDEVVAYRQIALSLNDTARIALAGNREVILPLFSPRSAQIFFEQATSVTARLQMIVISKAVKGVILGSNLPEFVDIIVADTPDAAAMLQAIKRCIVT